MQVALAGVPREQFPNARADQASGQSLARAAPTFSGGVEHNNAGATQLSAPFTLVILHTTTLPHERPYPIVLVRFFFCGPLFA